MKRLLAGLVVATSLMVVPFASHMHATACPTGCDWDCYDLGCKEAPVTTSISEAAPASFAEEGAPVVELPIASSDTVADTVLAQEIPTPADCWVISGPLSCLWGCGQYVIGACAK